MLTRVVLPISLVGALLLLGSLTVIAQGPLPQSPQVPLGTTFTYHGQLKKNGVPVTAACAIAFTLWDAETNGTKLGVTDSTIVTVANGLFTAAVNSDNQFGPDAFNGQERWLQTQVQCPGDVSAVTLSRQPLSAVPYAHFAAAPWVTFGNHIAYNRGMVGIGTLSPSQALDVQGSALLHAETGPSILYLRNRTSADYSAVVIEDSSGIYRGYLGYIGSTYGDASRRDHVEFGTNGKALTFLPNETEVMRLTVSGTVGIGTTSPCLVKLHIYDGSAVPTCQVAAVVIESTNRNGVAAAAGSAVGVLGYSDTGKGVVGESYYGGIGVQAHSTSGTAVDAYSGSGTAVSARTYSGSYIFDGYDGAFNLRFLVERATGNVKADGSFTSPADFAEMMSVSGTTSDYTTGDVLIIGSDGKVMLSNKPYAVNLAGVYSAKPGFLGDTDIATRGLTAATQSPAQGRLAVALLGIVPVKVTDENGAIAPGDLLTTSSTPGHAMKAKPVVIQGVEIYPTGAIIGKALEAWQEGAGAISVLVTLR